MARAWTEEWMLEQQKVCQASAEFQDEADGYDRVTVLHILADPEKGVEKDHFVGFNPPTMTTVWASDKNAFERFASQQIYYSLQSRDAENELVPISLDQGVGTLVWSPLAGGLLTGKYRRGVDAPEGTRRFEGWTEPPIYDEDRLYNTVEELVAIAKDHDASPTQVGLAYTLAKPGVTSVIVGARTEEQLSDSLKSADLKLSDAEIKRLDDASATPLHYPYWHQANTSDGRASTADLSLIGRHLRN